MWMVDIPVMYSKSHLLGLLTGASKWFTGPVLQQQGLFLSYWISLLAGPQLKTISETSSAQIICHTSQRNFDLGPRSDSVGLNALLWWKVGVRWLTLSRLIHRKAETNRTAEVYVNNATLMNHSVSSVTSWHSCTNCVSWAGPSLIQPVCAGCSTRWSWLLCLFLSQHVVLMVYRCRNGNNQPLQKWKQQNWLQLTQLSCFTARYSYITNGLFLNELNKGASCLRYSLHMR